MVVWILVLEGDQLPFNLSVLLGKNSSVFEKIAFCYKISSTIEKYRSGKLKCIWQKSLVKLNILI